MRRFLLVLTLAALPTLASAQSVEDQLRDRLRKTTIDLRAAQDVLATTQAQLADMTRARDAAVAERDALKAKADAAPAPVAAAPAAPAEDLQRLQTALDAAETRAKTSAAEAARAERVIGQATAAARTSQGEVGVARGQASAAGKVIELCRAENAKLSSVANDILHLYQTHDFRNLLFASYEPLLGLKRVELENTVQDYEDKIRDQRFVMPKAEAAK